MKKDGKYRYSLQFDAITDEQIQVGELLEKLGNRKSAIIVPALFEYIKRHPEITEDHAKIKVQVQEHQSCIYRSQRRKLVFAQFRCLMWFMMRFKWNVRSRESSDFVIQKLMV